MDNAQLKALGNNGASRASDLDELTFAFEKAAEAIINKANSLYTFGGCSPKRSGKHTLQIALLDTDDCNRQEACQMKTTTSEPSRLG